MTVDIIDQESTAAHIEQLRLQLMVSFINHLAANIDSPSYLEGSDESNAVARRNKARGAVLMAEQLAEAWLDYITGQFRPETK